MVVRGPLGAGKTTIAKELSRIYHAAYISIDVILEEFGLEEWENGYVSESSFLKANEIAATEALKNLVAGKPVIFDGNFYFKNVILDLLERLKKFIGIVITLSVPLDECIRRDSSRVAGFGEKETRLVYKKAREFRFGSEVNANRNLEEVLDSIKEMINDRIDDPF